jgi:hypothetical protein
LFSIPKEWGNYIVCGYMEARKGKKKNDMHAGLSFRDERGRCEMKREGYRTQCMLVIILRQVGGVCI